MSFASGQVVTVRQPFGDRPTIQPAGRRMCATSQAAASIIIDALIAVTEVRERFTRHPLAAPVELQFCAGLELTPDEMRALACVDPDVWSSSAPLVAGRLN